MCKNPSYFPMVGKQGDRTEDVNDLTGLLIDARCYALTRDNYTNAHAFSPGGEKVAKGCASACAKSGVPVALLLGPLPPTEQSKAIILLHPSPNLASYMEKSAKVTGYYMKDMNAIFTTCVKVLEGEEWKDIEFTTPMIGMSLAMKEHLTSDTPPTFSQVRALFREKDVESMKSLGIDLSDYATVADNADRIYERVKEGTMPCDGAWSQDKVQLFKKWIDGGKVR